VPDSVVEEHKLVSNMLEVSAVGVSLVRCDSTVTPPLLDTRLLGPVKIWKGEGTDLLLTVIIQFNQVSDTGSLLFADQYIAQMQRGIFFDRTIDKSFFDNEGEVLCEEFEYAIFKLAICVAFFSVDNHERLMPDIPRKKIVQYVRARKAGDNQTMKELEEEAREVRRGTGFLIREIELPTNEVVRRKQSKETGTGRHHQWGHFRRPHLHTVTFGKDRNEKKVVWFERIRVRPDLPLKPVNGYKIRDELLQRRKEYRKQEAKGVEK
jgi:hypothetical protein